MKLVLFTNAFILGFFTLAGRVHAQNSELNRTYRSAHFLGRGDAGIATADQEEAVFYNPAGLAYGKDLYKKTILLSPMAELSLATRDLIRQVQVEDSENSDALKEAVGKGQHLGVYNFSGVMFRRVALGAFTSSQTNILVSKDKDNGALETVDAHMIANQGISFTLAEQFFDNRFLIGGTTKYYAVRAQADFNANVIDSDKLNDLNEDELLGKGSGTGFDFGMMFRSKSQLEPALGITVENVGNTVFAEENKEKPLDNIKQTINVGTSVSPGTRFTQLRLFADFRDATGVYEQNTFKRIHLGSEISFKDWVGFTAGLGQGYPSGGVYVDVRFVRLDFGAYTQELGETAGSRPDPRFYFRLTAGF